MKKRIGAGFTLIELIVVIAIVGLLAAIALPSYQSQIRKTRRADVKTALTRISTLEEQYYSRKNQYSNSFDDLFGSTTYGATYTTDNGGYYSITITLNTVNTAGDAYTVYGKATAAGNQTKDTNCLTYTVDNYGTKKAYSSLTTFTSATETTTNCW